MADRDRSSGAPLRQAMQGQGASAHPLPPAARRAAQGANTPQATETAGRRGEERYFEAATAHANARVEPPLASCTLLIGRRYVLVVGSTDRLVRSPEDPLDEMHDSILERDGKGWKRLHSLLLIHKQPALYQRQHLQQQCTRRLQQQHLHQYCFSRPPTWERIGEKLMSTPEADRCLRQTLQWLQEEPEQRLRAAGLIGFLQLLCGFHLVVGIGARPAARLLLHHTVWSLEDITLLPLFFVVDTAQEAAPYCCSLPPTLSLLHHLCHASGEHEPRHRAQDRVYEQQVQALSAALADVSFPYRKRGLNDAGDAANEVEVEFACQATMPSRAATLTAAQAVALAPEETAALPDGLWRQVLLHGGGGFECAIASHVVSRGSAPVLWCQDTAVIPSRPRIRRRITDVNWSAIRRHMASLLQRYGSPLLLVNLLRSSPRKSVAAAASQTSPRAGAAIASLDDWYSEEAAATATIAEQEAHLGEEYRRAVDVLNAELPPSVQLRFAAVDVEAARRVNPRGASKRVEALAAETLNDLQFFASNESASQLAQGPLSSKRGRGVTPCVVLRAVALLTDASGDDVALQYGGSAAHRKRLEPLAWASQLPVAPATAGSTFGGSSSRLNSEGPASSRSSAASRQPSPLPAVEPLLADDAASEGSHSSNSSSLAQGLLAALQGVPSALAAKWIGEKRGTVALLPLLPGLSTSLQRRYTNVLEDGRKQQALNIWFGLYAPLKAAQHQPPIWRLEDGYDVYIHHNFLEPSFCPKDWWVLPLQRFFNGMRAAISANHCCTCCTPFWVASPDDAAVRHALERTGGGAAAPAAPGAVLAGCCRCQCARNSASAAAARATEAFLLHFGPSWVVDFLPSRGAGTAVGCSCGGCLCSSTSSELGGKEGFWRDETRLFEVFTYAPWLRQATEATAAPTTPDGGACRRMISLSWNPTGTAMAAAPTAGAKDEPLRDFASEGAAAPLHRGVPDTAEPQGSMDVSFHDRNGIQQGLPGRCSDCGSVSLALLLPQLIDSTAAAARALQCCCAQQLRESEQQWTYITLQQLQQQQEKEERMGSSCITKWASPFLLLQQRSSSGSVQQRLLQAHRARRLTKDTSLFCVREGQQPAPTSCCSGACAFPQAPSNPKTLLLFCSSSAKALEADRRRAGSAQQKRRPVQQEGTQAFRQILDGQLRRAFYTAQQQRQLQHGRAMKGLPCELQQQLQQLLKGIHSTPERAARARLGEAISSDSPVSGCWPAAVSKTTQHPAELHAMHQDVHLARLQRQQEQLEASLLQPLMYPSAPDILSRGSPSQSAAGAAARTAA
ncbi:hypothetical protein cyc_06709 [Cyclospora cayetanensis]|uniref:SAC domain-containing protein n=1 Tax=Cyclospora cayetanensis TaxID=88456 RepID=A0A1D3CQW2_9EIME|nr:hypothetical protein cyc_06709 [Cyclospora cayetanensis]